MVRVVLLLSHLVLLSSILLSRYQNEIKSFQWSNIQKYTNKVKHFFENLNSEHVISNALKFKDQLVEKVTKFDYANAAEVQRKEISKFILWFQKDGQKEIIQFVTDFAIDFKRFTIKYGTILYHSIRVPAEAAIDYIRNFDPEKAQTQLVQIKDKVIFYVENFNHTEAQHAILTYSAKIKDDVSQHLQNVNITALRLSLLQFANQARVTAIGVSGEVVLFLKSIDTKPAQDCALVLLKQGRQIGQHGLLISRVVYELAREYIAAIDTKGIKMQLDASLAYSKELVLYMKEKAIVVYVYLKETSPDNMMIDGKALGLRVVDAVQTFDRSLALERAKSYAAIAQARILSFSQAAMHQANVARMKFIVKYQAALESGGSLVVSADVSPVEPVQAEVAPVEPVQEEVAPVEPVQVEVAPVEPVQEEAAPVESVQEEVAPVEPVQEEVAPVEPVQEEAAHVESVQEEVAPVEPVQEETRHESVMENDGNVAA